MSARKAATAALTLLLVTAGMPVVTAQTSWAAAQATTATATADETAASVAAAAAEAARNEVTRIAKSRLPAELRTSAWNALRSSLGDAAITAWLAPGGGYDLAKQRLRDTRTRNRMFCERVAATHTAAFSPQVHAAASNALRGTDADRAAFVKSGYAAAQVRDREARAADTAHQNEVSAREKDFIRALGVADPGAEVRVAAQWALRAGATDTDVAEFFGYGWANGATLDLDGYRLRVADAETRRHHGLSLLVQKAVAAEAAIPGAADAESARADAVAAWRAVAGHAEAARLGWLADQAVAAAQARNWQDIAVAAQADGGPIWKNIAAPAVANQGYWSQEEAEATVAVASWQDILDQASRGEERVKG
ncbi:hypothetical protein ABT160_45405 [Streptomyces sp. NPDC001941]|uniref:hypothetical protein n=1 Tax=Streptomyces sp. NPDC001941 TaxID=3154659 RepID=UPI00332EC500